MVSFDFISRARSLADSKLKIFVLGEIFLGNYRNRFDIIANILKIASEGAKKTQIMYQCNLSYKLLTKYLVEVTESYLIRYESRKRRYTITSKGKEFLEGYKDYSKHNKHVERQLSDVQNKRKALEELCTNK